MTNVSKMHCGVIGCVNPVAGYLAGEGDIQLDPALLPAVNACWCRDHQQRLVVQTASEPEQFTSDVQTI
jgi:hypothetical protein